MVTLKLHSNDATLLPDLHITCAHKKHEGKKVCPRTLSKTSQLLTAPSTGLWLPLWPPSMLSLRRNSSSVCVSSAGQARVRAHSCSRDSELWMPREHSWSWASASLQLDTMEAFIQRCWLWHSDTIAQLHWCDDGNWCEVSGSRGKKWYTWTYWQSTDNPICTLMYNFQPSRIYCILKWNTLR